LSFKQLKKDYASFCGTRTAQHYKKAEIIFSLNFPAPAIRRKLSLKVETSEELTTLSSTSKSFIRRFDLMLYKKGEQSRPVR